MDLADFSGSRGTSVGSSEGFGGLSRKFLCTYTLKVSIKRISSGRNDPQYLMVPEIALKNFEKPEFFSNFGLRLALQCRAGMNFMDFA